MMKTVYHIIVALLSACLLAEYGHASPKVTQAAMIDFPLNEVIALAVEELNKAPVLVFCNNNDVVYSIEFGDHFVTFPEFAYSNSFLRFRTFDVEGVLSPLLIAIAAMPGGSDWGFEVKIIAEKEREITILNPEPISLNVAGGLYIGEINSTYGHGMMVWRFLWENEAHLAPHRYVIRIYTWNFQEQRFIFAKELITTRKYENDCDALGEYNLPCDNFRDMVIHIGEDFSTLGVEEAILQPRMEK